MTPADQIYSLPTTVGAAKLAYAMANQLTVDISHMAIGDGNGVAVNPTAAWSALAREVLRPQLNQLYQHPDNPNWLVAEVVLPAEVGGWTIREIGLYDVAGDLIFVGNHAEQYKPVQSQGSDETKTIRMVILVSSTASVTLKTDPTTVMATVDYVQRELAKLDAKQSVRYTTTGEVALAGLAVQAGGDWAGALTTGDRVLVKNQANGKDNGIYAAAAGAWLRVADADGSVEVTSGLVVAVEQGATLADTRWQLVTDGAIVLGTTPLVFQNVTHGFAPLASPIFIDNPRAPTPAQFDNDTSIATTEFVQRALGSYSGATDVANGSGADANAIGKNLNIGAGGSYLPSTVGIPNGAVLHYKNTGTGTHTLSRVGTDLISCDGTTRTTIDVGQGDDLTLVRVNNIWIGSGSAALKYAASFGSSLGTNGHKKIPDANSPSGFIIQQWGLTGAAAPGVPAAVTFPVAFPTACRSIQMTYVDGAFSQPATRGTPVQVGSFGPSSFQYSHSGTASGAQHFWFATGY